MTVMSEVLMMTEVTEVVIASAANQASTANCSNMISKICFWLEKKLILMSKRTLHFIQYFMTFEYSYFYQKIFTVVRV